MALEPCGVFQALVRSREETQSKHIALNKPHARAPTQNRKRISFSVGNRSAQSPLIHRADYGTVRNVQTNAARSIDGDESPVPIDRSPSTYRQLNINTLIKRSRTAGPPHDLRTGGDRRGTGGGYDTRQWSVGNNSRRYDVRGSMKPAQAYTRAGCRRTAAARQATPG
jgi:hypothetical protein